MGVTPKLASFLSKKSFKCTHVVIYLSCDQLLTMVHQTNSPLVRNSWQKLTRWEEGAFHLKKRMSRGTFSTSPLAPRGEVCPLGEMFTPSFTPRREHYLLFLRMEGWIENFIPRGKNSPLGTTSPLWSKFAPRGEVNNGPQALHQKRARLDVRRVHKWCNYVPTFISI
jgi:hypothetical protein